MGSSENGAENKAKIVINGLLFEDDDQSWNNNGGGVKFVDDDRVRCLQLIDVLYFWTMPAQPNESIGFY